MLLSTGLLIGGVALGAAGGVFTIAGGAVKSREDEERHKQMVDYEEQKLGRRDSILDDPNKN